MLYTDHRFTDTQLLDLISPDLAAAAIYTGDELVISAANEAMLNLWGGKPGIVGSKLGEALPDTARQLLLPLLQQVRQSGETVSEQAMPLNFKGKGQTRSFNSVGKALKDAGGSIYGIMHTLTEAPDAKANPTTGLTEQHFRKVINHSPVAMGLLSGEDLVIELANEPLLRVWHKKAADVMGRPLLKVFTNPYQQPYPEYLRNVLQTGVPYHNAEETVWIQRPEGPVRHVLNLSYTPVTDDRGKITHVLLTGIDVTDQVQYRQTMNLAQEQFMLAIDSTQLGTWSVDAATRNFQPSGRFKELYGYFPYEEMPENAALKLITDDYRGKVIAAINAAIDSSEEFKIIYPITRAHDKAISWIQANGKLYRDSSGQPDHLAGVILDVTEQQQQLAQQNDFIAMASHELKNPVTSIKGLAQVVELMLRKEGNFKMADMMLKVQNQVGRLITLIGDLLDVTKLEAGKLQFEEAWFDFNNIVTDTIEEMQATTHKHDIISNLNFHGQVFGDKERIRQVIINFISNAIKYSPDADTIIVNTTVNSGFVELYVKDFGIGIDRRHLKRVFDQFYRVTGSSEKKFKGLGLGLYISATIIRRSGGKIWADSEVGSGSTFCFALPAG